MGKLLDLLIKVVLAVLFCLALVESSYAQPMREKVAAVYLSQEGVRELTGHNDGKEVEKYLRSVGLGKGYPWCAAFVHWVLIEAGATNVPKSGYVPNWFAKNRIVYKQGKEVLRTPMRGDCFGIWFVSMRRPAHIGFVHYWGPGKYLTTIEGNTGPDGGRDGDGVYRRYRLKSQIWAVSSHFE